MMKKLVLPLLLAVLGAAGGAGAGLALRPGAEPPAPAINPCGETGQETAGHEPADGGHAAGEQDYVKLNNQFVVPVVSGDLVQSLVVMSLNIEIRQGQRETVFAREPKLRDALLQVMFDHANMGGFDGAFTDGNTLDALRTALTESAREVLGDGVRNVLIVDIARQDV